MYYLDSQQLKRPKGFTKEYIFTKNDTSSVSGKTQRDSCGKKQKFILNFENLTLSQVTTLQTIINKNKTVIFLVSEKGILNINANVIPYIGSIVYDTVGSDYRASLQLELIEEI
jgi:hypothetical protein